MGALRRTAGARREALAAIARVLREDWDPIGVEGVPADEYDAYVGDVYGLLARGATPEQIAAHLARLERSNMGLQPREATALLPVASRLRALGLRLAP